MTALDAQLSVETGFRNVRGLTHIQRMASTVMPHAQGPIQTRLQTATIRAGSAVNRVQTLQGWHVSPMSHPPSKTAGRFLIQASFA